jgi:hypothetical protein
MPLYRVTADRVTTYIVRADSDDEAIDAMTDGEGKEEDTTTMSITATELEPDEVNDALRSWPELEA